MGLPESYVGERGLRSFREDIALSLVPQEVVAADDRSAFAARVVAAEAADMTVIGLNVTPVRAHRDPGPDAGDDDVFILYADAASGVLTHRRGSEPIAAGRTIVIPASERFDVSYARTSSLVFVCVPGRVAAGYRRLHGPIRSVELGPIGRAVMRVLPHVPLGPAAEAGPAVRAVVALASSAGDDGSGLRWQAERLIERHLADPRLGTGMLAALLNASERTLERAFAGEGVARFIRTRRLQVAAERLRTEPGTPVSAIAADAGFGSASRFAGYFRERFGTTPAQWREAGR